MRPNSFKTLGRNNNHLKMGINMYYLNSLFYIYDYFALLWKVINIYNRQNHRTKTICSLMV